VLAVILGERASDEGHLLGGLVVGVFSALLAYRGAIFKDAQSAKEALVL
jgi:hypothetical protein